MEHSQAISPRFRHRLTAALFALGAVPLAALFWVGYHGVQAMAWDPETTAKLPPQIAAQANLDAPELAAAAAAEVLWLIPLGLFALVSSSWFLARWIAAPIETRARAARSAGDALAGLAAILARHREDPASSAPAAAVSAARQGLDRLEPTLRAAGGLGAAAAAGSWELSSVAEHLEACRDAHLGAGACASTLESLADRGRLVAVNAALAANRPDDEGVAEALARTADALEEWWEEAGRTARDLGQHLGVIDACTEAAATATQVAGARLTGVGEILAGAAPADGEPGSGAPGDPLKRIADLLDAAGAQLSRPPSPELIRALTTASGVLRERLNGLLGQAPGGAKAGTGAGVAAAGSAAARAPGRKRTSPHFRQTRPDPSRQGGDRGRAGKLTLPDLGAPAGAGVATRPGFSA